MTLPVQIESQIRKRFEELVTEAERLLQIHIEDSRQSNTDRLIESLNGVSESTIRESSDLVRLRTNISNLLELLSSKRSSFDGLKKALTGANIVGLHGMLLGLKSDYEAGMLKSITELIEANVTADYLLQAEQLLGENKQGQYGHVPAAVLSGAVLEDTLRRLCGRQNPSISTNKPGGHPKMLGTLIDGLKNAGLFNELRAKQLRAWADIRNAAAHGEYAKFNRQDVETMLQGIQSFLADHL